MMRQLLHPGPVAPNRMSVVAASPVPLHFILKPGDTVDVAIANGFAEAGCRGGLVSFAGGACEPFQFVIPAASADGAHAAWYSDAFAPNGPVELVQCVASVGERDEKPFIHCHGAWRTGEGLRMGHMLPFASVITQPIAAAGIGFTNATFRGTPDPETNFTLFEPHESLRKEGGSALLVRIRPNEDVCTVIETICREHGIVNAEVLGIGSLNEVRFADGRRVASHATELLIRRGCVKTTDGAPRALLDIAVVDMNGTIAEGEILHGDNPVCVTFELVIIPQAA